MFICAEWYISNFRNVFFYSQNCTFWWIFADWWINIHQVHLDPSVQEPFFTLSMFTFDLWVHFPANIYFYFSRILNPGVWLVTAYFPPIMLWILICRLTPWPMKCQLLRFFRHFYTTTVPSRQPLYTPHFLDTPSPNCSHYQRLMSGGACASSCPWGARKRAWMFFFFFLNAGDWSLDWLVRSVASTKFLTSHIPAPSCTFLRNRHEKELTGLVLMWSNFILQLVLFDWWIWRVWYLWADVTVVKRVLVRAGRYGLNTISQYL